MTGPRRLVIAVTITLAIVGVATVLLERSYRPNSGPDVFDSKASFDRYVAAMRLASFPLEQAGASLVQAGFRCEPVGPGNLGCYRKVIGSNCGERQFVDLGQEPVRLRVSTRFSLTCD